MLVVEEGRGMVVGKRSAQVWVMGLMGLGTQSMEREGNGHQR